MDTSGASIVMMYIVKTTKKIETTMNRIKALLLLIMIGLAVNVQAQDEKPVEEVKETVAEEVAEEEVMEPKTIAFEEPPFAMDIEQSNLSNSQGIANAFSIEILNADKKLVEKKWRALMKSYLGKTKFNKKEAEMSTTNARVTEMGSNAYTVRANIQERGGNVVVHSWFENSEGYVVDGDEASGVKTLLSNFAVEVRKGMVDNELTSEEKTLKKTETELTRLKKQNDGYHRDIEKAKKVIADSELKIIENEKMQLVTQEKIDGQRAIVEAIRKRLKLIE